MSSGISDLLISPKRAMETTTTSTCGAGKPLSRHQLEGHAVPARKAASVVATGTDWRTRRCVVCWEGGTERVEEGHNNEKHYEPQNLMRKIDELYR
mmetsp:Transcript_21884/g.62770  ORF Transcript_21884/g.62770 Transcript_21884/m.62770 type:complete len:96 (+) Transcript_21884:2096-2383(+)